MSRIVSFCFDDGFMGSVAKVCAIFEARALRATFCALAAAEETQDPFIRGRPLADWGWWREARAAGHEVAPHGWAHERLDDLPTAEACAGLDRTLDVFAAELPGFEARETLFHLAYLAAPDPVVSHLSERTLGVRRRLGRNGLNPLTGHIRGASVDCITFGTGADEALLGRVDLFARQEEGWLLLVLHGLDGEGWGPVRSDTLTTALDRLAGAGVSVRPASQVMLETLSRP